MPKPRVAKYYYNLDGETETSRQLATSGGREIIAVIITAGSSAAVARIADTSTSTVTSRDSFLIAANTGESTPFVPNQPIPFSRGLYIVLEQGAAFGAEVFVAYN